MNRTRLPLVWTWVATGLFVLAVAGTTLLGSMFAFGARNSPGLSMVRTVTLLAAALAAGCLFASMGIVAVRAALEPAGWLRKPLYVLPVYLLGFTLAGVILAAFGIGTVGPFIAVWLIAGAVLGMIAAITACVRMGLGARTLQTSLAVLAAGGVVSLIAWLGILASIAIVLTSRPGSLPTRSGSQAGPARDESPAAATTTAQGVQTGQGAPRLGPGRSGPGGPRGRAPSALPFVLGASLATLFGAIELGGIRRGMRRRREVAAETGAQTPESGHLSRRQEAGRAIVTCVAITVAALALIQLVPVSHDNPPIQTAVAWDSPQTRSLASRACMDCHSNETTWPAYSYIAPASWLTRSHVSSGRDTFNLSALNAVQAFRRARLPEDVQQSIRNGSMPPQDYLILHPEARLTPAEKERLIQGLQTTLTR